MTAPRFDLRLGDCLGAVGLSTIAGKSIDHAILDAPYSEHVEHGQAVSGRRTGQAVVRKDAIGVGWLTRTDVSLLCEHLARVTKRWIVAFCAWEQSHWYAESLAECGRYVRTCAWAKPDATPQLTGDRPATWGECMVVGYATDKGRMRWNGGGKRGLYVHGVCRGVERSDHPTQKPLSLMREIVEDFTDPGDVVIDPFAGSGSTGVACLQLGRRFVGFEKNPDYYAIATRRLTGDEACPDPSQPSLFGGLA